MDEAILKKIKSLPPMPESVHKIQAICNDPDAGVSDLIEIVEKDPTLTANLLKAANSPLYGFSREIKSAAQAVSLFGMATVKGFAIASAVRSSFKMDLAPYNMSSAQFIHISDLQNGITIKWYKKVNKDLLDVLASTSFLLEIGKVILADYVKKISKTNEFKKKITGEGEETPQEIVDIEKEFFGVTSEEVAAQIFEHWNFESKMVDTMKYVNNPDEADDEIKALVAPLLVVKKAVNIRECLTENSLQAAHAVIEQYGLSADGFESAIEDMPKSEG